MLSNDKLKSLKLGIKSPNDNKLIPIIVDSLAPASHIFGINEEHLNLYTLKDENFRFEKFMKPVNQNIRLAKIYWMGALGSDNNSRHFKFTGITG